MRHKKEELFLCALLVLMLMILSGCSKSGKSEKEVIKDLQASPVFISADVVISDYEIIKRKTDVDSKTDEIYIIVHTKAAELTSSLTYELKYELYNEGWILESVMRYWDGPWEFSGLSDEQLLADIKNNDYYFSDWDLDVETVEIEEESCDSNAMVYYEKRIVAALTAHNTLFDYYATYNMYYGVVDGVWALQSAEVRSRRYAPTFSPNTASTDQVIEELTLGEGSSATQYDSFEYLRTEADWENCTEVRYYTATKDWWFGTETYLIAIPLGFSLENGEDHAMWTYRSDTIESILQSVDWSIEGIWTCNYNVNDLNGLLNAYAMVKLNIVSIASTDDPGIFSVSLSCDARCGREYSFYCKIDEETAATLKQVGVGKYLLSIEDPTGENVHWEGGFYLIAGPDPRYSGFFWKYNPSNIGTDGARLQKA